MTSFCCDRLFRREALTPTQSRSDVLEIRTSTYGFGGTIQPTMPTVCQALGVQCRPDLIAALPASDSATR